MSDTPKHVDIAIEYFTLAKELGSYEEANKHFQFRSNGCWDDLHGKNLPSFSPYMDYRRKPQTHIVNGHEVPAPYRRKPDHNSYYYWVRHHKVNHACWEGHDCDIEALKLNNCFKSESDAEENRLAMFKLGKYAEVKP